MIDDRSWGFPQRDPRIPITDEAEGSRTLQWYLVLHIRRLPEAEAQGWLPAPDGYTMQELNEENGGKTRSRLDWFPGRNWNTTPRQTRTGSQIKKGHPQN